MRTKAVLTLFIALAMLLCTGCIGYETHEKTDDELLEEARREEEEYIEEMVRESSADEISPSYYEQWREYHEFKLYYVTDDAEPVDSKYVDALGYCAPYEYMGAERAWENVWLVYEGIDVELYKRLMRAETAEEFDKIFNEEVNGVKSAMIFEQLEEDGPYEYVWDLSP